MDLQITPKKLSGAVTPPSSKSQAHRLLIAAALSGGISVIHGLADSQDIRATRRCLSAMLSLIHICPLHGALVFQIRHAVLRHHILDAGAGGGHHAAGGQLRHDFGVEDPRLVPVAGPEGQDALSALGPLGACLLYTSPFGCPGAEEPGRLPERECRFCGF